MPSKFDALGVLIKLSFRYDINVFHRIRYSDLVMPPLRVLVISPVALKELVPIGKEEDYARYVAEVAGYVFNMSVTPQLKTYAKAIAKMEIDLRDAITKVMKNRHLRSRSERISIREMAESSHGFSASKWVKHLNEQLESDNASSTVNQETIVVLNDRQVFDAVGNFIEQYQHKQALADFIGWQVVKLMGFDTIREILTLTVRYISGLQNLTVNDQVIRAKCAQKASVLLPIAYNAFVSRHFVTKKSEKAVTKMAKMLRDQFVKRLKTMPNEMKWLQGKSRETALEKLKALKFIVPSSLPKEESAAFAMCSRLPDVNTSANFLQVVKLIKEIHGAQRLPLENTDHSVVDVTYHTASNKIFISAGSLNSPFYEDDLPPALNFGGLGKDIVQELYRAITGEGRFYNHKHEFQNWWTPLTQKNYGDIISCLKLQRRIINGTVTSNQTDENDANISLALSTEPFPTGVVLDEVEVLLEASALRQTFVTYHSAFASDLNRLKGAEALSPEQLYFVNACHRHCGSIDNTTTSPLEMPCNRAVSQIVEFQQTFNCKLSDPMNGVGRCQLL